MHILVTGSEGYLGALLTPMLIARGHDVTGVDAGFYTSGQLFRREGVVPRTLAMDIRRLEASVFDGVNAVVHMAELSNDPTGELSPKITHAINHAASVRLARLAKEAGAERFVYMSSCSVYGAADGHRPVDEDSPINPQTAYAVCKSLCERDIGALAGDGFSPVFLRNATAFGASPRQRFDLVVNDLAGLAWTHGDIRMVSDGTPWRPLVHGLDIARAICCALDAPRERIHNEVVNIGSDDQNYQVRDIADIVGTVFQGCTVTFGDQGADKRSYRVSFAKAAEVLPDFRCEWDAMRGVRQLRALFQRIDLTREVFQAPPFTRLKQLQYLIRTGQIDENFFWTEDV
jgi:nucleoside-diphosphate-sugar epimerase